MVLVEKRQQYKCVKCNQTRDPERCPAFGRACFLCRDTNHFAACCRNSPRVAEGLNDQGNLDIIDVRVCSVVRKVNRIINAKVTDQAVF